MRTANEARPHPKPDKTTSRWSERGEMSAWLILAAALAAIASLLSPTIQETMHSLASAIGGAPATIDGGGSDGNPPTPTNPSGGDPTTVDPSSPTNPSGGETVLTSGPPVDAGADPEAAQAQAALDEVQDILGDDGDYDVSNGELNDIRDQLDGLSPDQIAAVLSGLSDAQIEALFHNVHSSGFWSNDWDDRERDEFYDIIDDAGPLSDFLDSDPTDNIALDKLDPETRRDVLEYRPEVYVEIPAVITALSDAWTDSNPGTGTDPNRREQGGWLVVDDDGNVSVDPWPAGAAASVPIGPRPDNALGMYHTHPNIGGNWQESPSDPDIEIAKTVDYAAPHYVVSDGTIWVIDSDGNVTALGTRTGTIGN